MPTPADAAAAYAAVVTALRESLGASRATLRLACDGRVGLVAESHQADVVSMRAGTQEDATRYPTYEHLIATRAVLVQNDLRTHPVRAPQSLIDEYGTLAQMLGPVQRSGELAGVISVHMVGRTRDWTASDIAQLRLACRTIENLSSA